MTLEQHNIPSIILLLTQFFERSEVAECRKSLQRHESGYTWLSLQGAQSKRINRRGCAQLPVSGWGCPPQGLMHMQLSKIFSPWGALHYFDITLTVKTEEDLVIHTAACHSVSDERPYPRQPAAFPPAHPLWAPRTEPAAGEGGRSPARAPLRSTGSLGITRARPVPGPGGALSSRSVSHFLSSLVARTGSPIHSRHWKGTDRGTCQSSNRTTFPALSGTAAPLQFGPMEIPFFFPFACTPVFEEMDSASLQWGPQLDLASCIWKNLRRLTAETQPQKRKKMPVKICSLNWSLLYFSGSYSHCPCQTHSRIYFKK